MAKSPSKSYLSKASKNIVEKISKSKSLDDCRNKLMKYLEEKEEFLLSKGCDKHPLVIAHARDAIKTFKNLLSEKNEERLRYSTLETLRETVCEGKKVSEGFIEDFFHLFKAVEGDLFFYKKEVPNFLEMKGRKAAKERSDFLDTMWDAIWKKIENYKSGLDDDVIERRKENKKRILKYFKGKTKDWEDWRWHVKHIIRDSKTLGDLIEISDDTRKAVDLVSSNRIPFGVTPYYLSLMDKELGSPYDNAVRNQVIPPIGYANEILKFRTTRGEELDFMKEGDTSPVDLVTRRYPSIAILKPFNTCPQICIYCQRNWEIEEVMSEDALASYTDIKKAVKWYNDHPAVREMLITGGDPSIMNDEDIEEIFDQLAKIPHLERIRFATRIPVTLPMRVTDNMMRILTKHHKPPFKMIYIVTHIEHPYEITPELFEAIQRYKNVGFEVYNQQVFTPFNSRRFETVALRRVLKLVGIDPYYTFNPKGKKEAKEYLVPVARILQERKEEARFTPGSWRTDEPVFNVPGLGKNHLRAYQDHTVIGIKPDGARVYEFHPWEKNIVERDTYISADMPILDYLNRLEEIGENPDDYISIWYYY